MQRVFLSNLKSSTSTQPTYSMASRFLKQQKLLFSTKNNMKLDQYAQSLETQQSSSQSQPSFRRFMFPKRISSAFEKMSLNSFYLSQQPLADRFFMNKKEDSKDGDDQKVPKGFEKFFKKKGAENQQAQKTQNKDDKTEKKEESQKEEEHISEEEDSGDKTRKGSSEDKKDKGDNALRNFFFQPNGGPPVWENWLVAGLMTMVIYYYLNSKSPSQEITYLDFINQYLSKNQVKMITIAEDKSNDMFKYRAEIETLEGKKVHLVLPQVENFLYKLDLAQREMGKVPNQFVPVKYASEASKSDNNAMVNFMIGGLFLVFMLQIYRSMHGKGGSGGTGVKGGSSKPGGTGGSGSGGGFGKGGMGDIFGMGKSNVQIYGVDKKIKTKFKHVAGMEQAKVEITEFVDFLKDPKKYQKLGAQVPRGALLVGPPGTGKTLLAKAVAGEAGVPFLSISGSDFVEMFVGVGASRVRDLFKKARERAPSIIFIDEIDAVAKKRHGKFGGSNDERDNTLNQLLVEMDGFGTDESVIILAATNRSDILDSALMRPGRFDRQIEITLPTIKDRAEIFKVHLKKIKLNVEKTREDYARKMSSLTPGFSGAEISNVCNEAAIIAARTDLESVGIKEFEQAIERVIGGIEKKTVMTPEERKVIAYHESGHAVAGWFLEHSNPLLKITIIPRSKGSLGFAQYLPDEISLYTKEQIYDMICTALAGRISEELSFGKITTGAQDDIKKVTQYAQGLVTIYGMSGSMGLVGYNSAGGESQLRPYSDETCAEIDEEVKKIVMECYDRTKAILTEKQHLIKALAEELLAKESIGLPDIIKILGDRPFPMKETVKEYLQELVERKAHDDQVKQEEEDKKKDEPIEELKEELSEKPTEGEKQREDTKNQ